MSLHTSFYGAMIACVSHFPWNGQPQRNDTVTHCLVAFLQCTETSKTVSESSSSSGSLCCDSCLRCASVGMRRAGFSCLLSVEEMGDFYIVFEMSLWI
jgi:hypothetical protein